MISYLRATLSLSHFATLITAPIAKDHVDFLFFLSYQSGLRIHVDIIFNIPE